MPGKDLKNLYTVDNEKLHFLDFTVTNICKSFTAKPQGSIFTEAWHSCGTSSI